MISIRPPGATPTVRAAASTAVASPVAWLPGRADPDVDRDAAGVDALDQLVQAVVGDDGPRAVQLEDQGDGPALLGVGDLRLDEVDQDAVEQPADLDDGHVARVVALGGRGAGGGLGPQRAETEEYGHQTGPR